jgi:N-methylhydantoinase A
VIAPDMASVFSAFGMVNAPLKVSRATSLMRPLHSLDVAMLRHVFGRPEGEVRGRIGERDCRLEYGLDLKYLKQAHEIAVVEADWSAEQIAAAFEQRHHTLYGTALGHPLMVVTARLTAISDPRPLHPARRDLDGWSAPAPIRLAALSGVGTQVPVYDRGTLPPEVVVSGPCLIEERDTSFYMPPGATGRADTFGNLIVRPKTGEETA